MFACLTFTAFVTPFEVGFTETAYPLEGATLVAFLVNRVVDCFFIFDIYVNFCLAYFDADKEEWVYEPSRVRLHYMKGWCVRRMRALFYGVSFSSLGLGGRPEARVSPLREAPVRARTSVR